MTGTSGRLGWSYQKWLGAHAFSQLGLRIGTVAFPVLALKELEASAFMFGVVMGASNLAYLVFTLPVGAGIETRDKQRILVWSSNLRLVFCVAVLVAALTQTLTPLGLALLAFLIGGCSVFFDVALNAGLPERVAPDQFGQANAGFEFAQSVAILLGPAGAGILLSLFDASTVILADGIIFALAGVFAALPGPRPAQIPTDDHGDTLLDMLKAGLRFCWANEVIRGLLITVTTSNFFATVIMTLQPILILEALSGDAANLAIAAIAGALGGLSGALNYRTVSRRLSQYRLMEWGLCGAAGFAAVIAAAAILQGNLPDEYLIWACYVAEFGIVFSIVHFNISQVSLRQRVTPLPMMSRVVATARFCIWGSMPAAAVIAGAAVGFTGLGTVLAVAALGSFLTALYIIPVGRTAEASSFALSSSGANSA